MAAIFYFSGQPYEGPGMEWWEIAARKLGHLAAYALLTVGWWWAVRGRVARPIAWAAGLSLLYACSDEYHQTFVEGRTGKVLDVAIDSLGIALACLWLRARTRSAALSGSAGRPAAARPSAGGEDESAAGEELAQRSGHRTRG